jgi:hypothetical protein
LLGFSIAADAAADHLRDLGLDLLGRDVLCREKSEAVGD